MEVSPLRRQASTAIVHTWGILSLTVGLFLLLALALMPGCASEPDEVGTIELPLSAPGNDGARYRLADFTITISGPETRVIGDDGRDVIRAVLRAGEYSASLAPGFHLYRTAPGGTTEELMENARVEDAMQAFTIAPRGTTPVNFHFLADLGRSRGRTENGVVEIGVRVRPVGHIGGTARIDTVRGAAAQALAGATIDLDGTFVVRSRLDLNRGGAVDMFIGAAVDMFRGAAVDSFIRFDQLVISSVGDPTGAFDDRFMQDFHRLVLSVEPPGGHVLDPLAAPPPPPTPTTDGSPLPVWIYTDAGEPITLRSSTRVLRIFPATIDPPRLSDGRIAGLTFTITAPFEIVLDPGTSTEASVAGVVELESEVAFDPALIPPAGNIALPEGWTQLHAEEDDPIHFLGSVSEPAALAGWKQNKGDWSTNLIVGLEGTIESDELCSGVPEENGVRQTWFNFFAAWGEYHDNFDANNPYTPQDETQLDELFPYDDYDYAIWDWRGAACLDD